MKLIKRGAEANLYVTNFLGKKAILKRRICKPYRIKELDERIIKERISLELTLLHKAKQAGVITPAIYATFGNDIIMEFVRGELLKEYLHKVSRRKALRLCFLFGENIARLHNASIIHGDLTTSNIIVDRNNLVFIDFGLGFISSKDEDKATDLLVLKKIFLATHSRISEGWDKILEGYAAVAKNLKAKIAQIEKRARYL